VTGFDSLFEGIDLVELDDALARRAGELAEVRQLRGYDAVHLAAADRVRDPDVAVIAGDGALLEAATAEGLAVAELP
jgi:predicted nucleic acid-binding protein